jgi:hypothetical protein
MGKRFGMNRRGVRGHFGAPLAPLRWQLTAAVERTENSPAGNAPRRGAAPRCSERKALSDCKHAETQETDPLSVCSFTR